MMGSGDACGEHKVVLAQVVIGGDFAGTGFLHGNIQAVALQGFLHTFILEEGNFFGTDQPDDRIGLGAGATSTLGVGRPSQSENAIG